MIAKKIIRKAIGTFSLGACCEHASRVCKVWEGGQVLSQALPGGGRRSPVRLVARPSFPADDDPLPAHHLRNISMPLVPVAGEAVQVFGPRNPENAKGRVLVWSHSCGVRGIQARKKNGLTGARRPANKPDSREAKFSLCALLSACTGMITECRENVKDMGY